MMCCKTKRMLLCGLCLLFCAGSLLQAQSAIYEKDGIVYHLEALGESVFRIRAAARTGSVQGASVQSATAQTFPGESLMERYSLLNASSLSSGSESKVEQTADSIVLKTSSYTLVLDSRDASLTIRDNGGRLRVGRMRFIAPGSPGCVEMAALINKRYEGFTTRRNGGIIGDDDGSLSEADKTEGGDPAKSSIFSIGLSPNERFYGGGSTSREHIQHRGEILRMWATYQHTEIPVPCLMSSAGWGVFNNATRKNYFDVGCTDSGEMRIYNTDNKADIFIMLSDGMPGLLDLYTSLTGRNYLLPKWAYGFCFGPNMKEDQWDILGDALRLREGGFPCDLLWLEPQWMSKHYDFSTSKKWNYEKFTPEYFFREKKYPKQYYPSLFVGRLNDLGYHLGLWVCEEYDLSIAEEDALSAAAGLPQSGQEHWMDHLKTFIDMGAEGFKMDPARTLDEHTYRKYFNGQPDKAMHNLNQVLLPKQMNMMYREHTGKRGWYHYCGGYAGVQHWCASTSGDNGGGKVALFDQLNLSNSANMNTSCDVMFVPAEDEMASLHFGVFLPWMQVNSWCSMFHPFYYNDRTKDIYRKYLQLRYRLIPYIYSSAIEGSRSGMPILRSMPLAFPDDSATEDMWSQYMFGPNLLVGIFSDEVYLPEGLWYSAWTGEKVSSRGENFRCTVPEDRAGILMVKAGAIIPLSDRLTSIGTEPYTSYTVRVYPCGYSSYTLLDCDAESYGYEQGRVASTRFECRAEGSSVDFTIHPVEGSFENMPSECDYHIEFVLDRKPARVKVGGRKAQGEWDGKVFSIKLPAHKVSEKLSIELD